MLTQEKTQEEISEETSEVKIKNAYRTEFYDLRGANVFDVAFGTSVINGDFVDPMFEIYSHLGYKRHITPYLGIDIGYHKFNLAYIDVYNEGFMSFDLNLEVIVLPHSKFSPFIFAGAGLNASNHFKQTANKFQGGGGIEYIASEKIGVKLYTDYNYVLSDELDGLEAGNSDDTYFRLALGVNFYFGGSKMKSKKVEAQATVIDSNLLNDEYYGKK
ncbi:Curli production assembly/transport component CsgG [Psychroserpens ponticola]|uniref:Curli production assembly/transport component CsgG n=1 Tax=Psychroserpens ponticola TaxID=2932268 RepID=A0ABY7RZA9_9FLAO|nr:Curli production assembly/transport component CsgG [Psychroserpens ponticola]WCO02469.1 Curli production assembly/transport component CsgG [Psychroserpens ponticola]